MKATEKKKNLFLGHSISRSIYKYIMVNPKWLQSPDSIPKEFTIICCSYKQKKKTIKYHKSEAIWIGKLKIFAV